MAIPIWCLLVFAINSIRNSIDRLTSNGDSLNITFTNKNCPVYFFITPDPHFDVIIVVIIIIIIIISSSIGLWSIVNENFQPDDDSSHQNKFGQESKSHITMLKSTKSCFTERSTVTHTYIWCLLCCMHVSVAWVFTKTTHTHTRVWCTQCKACTL